MGVVVVIVKPINHTTLQATSYYYSVTGAKDVRTSADAIFSNIPR